MLASKISYIRSKLNEIEPAKNESVKKSGLILGAPTKSKGGYSMSTLKGMKEKQAGVRYEYDNIDTMCRMFAIL